MCYFYSGTKTHQKFPMGVCMCACVLVRVYFGCVCALVRAYMYVCVSRWMGGWVRACARARASKHVCACQCVCVSVCAGARLYVCVVGWVGGWVPVCLCARGGTGQDTCMDAEPDVRMPVCGAQPPWYRWLEKKRRGRNHQGEGRG